MKKEIHEQQASLLAQISAVEALRAGHGDDRRTGRDQRAERRHRRSKRGKRSAHRPHRLAQLVGWPRERDIHGRGAGRPQVPIGNVEEAVAAALQSGPKSSSFELNRQASAIDLAVVEGKAALTVSVTGS